jgi:hypothetical protein
MPQPNNGDRVALSMPPAAERFLAQNAIGTLSISRLDGSPHVTPVRFTGPDGRLTLTAYGQLFARDVAPVLKMLTPP